MEMAGSMIREALEMHALELADQVWGKRPASPFESVPDVDGRPWYIILANPQQEGIACSHMLARGLEAYLPMVLHEGVRAGRGVRNVHRPMFPGYLFLKMLFGLEYDRARNLPGVRGIMQKPGGGFPTPSEADIAFIKSQEKDALDPTPSEEDIAFLKALKAEKMAQYKPGRSVRVSSGPFGGFTGKIWRLAEHERITLLIDVFARPSPVEVDPSQIELL